MAGRVLTGTNDLIRLASRTQNLTVSLTLRIVSRAAELLKLGKDVVDLSVGQPDHPTPENVKRAGISAIQNNFTKYTAAAGTPELRKAIIEKFHRDNNLNYTIDQIVVSNGAKHSLSNAILALVEQGDEVIVPEPCWLSYPELVWLAGGTPVYVRTTVENGFHVRAEDIEGAISPKTKLVVLNSPCNPTGAILSETEIRDICLVVEKSNATIISDEIYEHLRFDDREHFSPASAPGMKDRTVVINGVSKCYSMTGWRIGYAAAEKHVADAMLRIQSQMTSSAGSISQMAALEGLNGDQSAVIEMRNDFSRRRDICYGILKSCEEIKLPKPEGAFYAFPDVSNFFGKRAGNRILADSNDIADYLIEEALVAVVPGSAFRSPECLRISYANSDENVKRGTERLCNALESLK